MANSAGFVPVSRNGVVSGNSVALVFVTVTVALAEPPAATEPKSSDVGDALIAPVGRLARFCGSIEAGCRTKSAALLPLSFRLVAFPKAWKFFPHEGRKNSDCL